MRGRSRPMSGLEKGSLGASGLGGPTAGPNLGRTIDRQVSGGAMELTVREVLEMPCLGKARLLAGGNGLHNVVRHVTVIDAPDAVEWLRGGEFVLTTAYHIKDDPSAQVSLIEALVRKKAACVGIKLRRFLDALSCDALDKADEKGLPVIQVPFELAWIDMINPILSDVMDRQTQLLEQSWEVHRRFLDAVLNGGDMKTVASTLATLLSRPVVVTDVGLHVLAKSPPGVSGTATGPVAGASPGQEESGLSESDGREQLALMESAIESVRESTSACQGASSLRNSSSPSSSSEMLKTDVDVRPVSLQASTLDASFLEGFRIVRGEGGSEVLVAEIRTKHETYGFIFVGRQQLSGAAEDESNGGDVLSQNEAIAVQQAATVAALEIIKQQATEQVERRYRLHFVDDLLQGNFETREALIRRARSCGWDFTRPHILMILDIDGFERYYLEHPGESERDMQRIKDRMLDVVNSGIVKGVGPVTGVDRSDSIVVLSPVTPGSSADGAKETALNLGRALRDRVSERLKPLTVSVGIGRFYPDVLLLRRSYLEAREALKLGRRVRGNGSTVHYDDLGVYRLILKCSDPAEVGLFVREHLGRLIEYDRAHRTNLVETLETHIKTNCCLKETASRLFVHVNTLKYRLRRIQDILGIDLRDPEELLNLSVAMKMKDISGLDTSAGIVVKQGETHA